MHNTSNEQMKMPVINITSSHQKAHVIDLKLINAFFSPVLVSEIKTLSPDSQGEGSILNHITQHHIKTQ
jgi:hypothetical protein